MADRLQTAIPQSTLYGDIRVRGVGHPGASPHLLPRWTTCHKPHNPAVAQPRPSTPGLNIFGLSSLFKTWKLNIPSIVVCLWSIERKKEQAKWLVTPSQMINSSGGVSPVSTLVPEQIQLEIVGGNSPPVLWPTGINGWKTGCRYIRAPEE